MTVLPRKMRVHVSLPCADCGYDLAPTKAQEKWALRTGLIPRPPCPANESGLHRVTDAQVWAANSHEVPQ